MSIRTSADSIHFSRFPSERAYANALSEGFDITSAGRVKQLSYWIADPQEHIRQRFGLLQEVLVIFSEHPIVDARALTAIDELSNERTLRLRIDRFIYFVISVGSDASTDALLKQSTDRVVIPIAALDLVNPQRGNFFLRVRIAEAIKGVDLFAMSSPVRSDKDFFGRED